MSGVPPMAAIATLLNPLAEDQLLTFWNNENGDLVLARRKNPHNPQDLIWSRTAKQTGILKNPSSIVAMLYQDTINVYGITSGPSPTLKLLSPIVNDLPHPIPVTGMASLAGVVTPDAQQAWLYYLGTNDRDDTVIYEYRVDGSSEPQILLQNQELKYNTYLAATCWSDGRRVVFFQAEDKIIKMVDVKHKSEVTLSQTTNTLTPTPMAACTAQDAKGNEILYLYYANRKNTLQRLTMTPTGKTEALPLSDAPQLAPWSQIAVTPGKTHNFISYVVTGGGKQKVVIVSDVRS